MFQILGLMRAFSVRVTHYVWFEQLLEINKGQAQ